jgi:hypothetical protein
MVIHSRSILADRPKVVPCLWALFRQSLTVMGLGEVMEFLTTFGKEVAPPGSGAALLHALAH